MNVRFHVFTGTGNTRHAAQTIAARLAAGGHNIEMIDIDCRTQPSASPAELNIFMFPIYATAVPVIMLWYLRRLQLGSNARAAVISTNGRVSAKNRDGYEGQALLQATRILRQRGYDVFLTDTLDYPHNITNFGPPVSPAKEKLFLEQTTGSLDRLAEKLTNGTVSLRHCFILNRIWSWLFGFLYSLVGRRFLGKIFVAAPNCNGCGHCVHHCPARTIYLAGKQPRWRWNCQGCLRCINICPRQAIQTSVWRFILLLILPLAVSPFIMIRGLIPPAALPIVNTFDHWTAGIGPYVINCFVYLWLFDILLFLLEKVPGLRWLMSRSYTQLYRRYQAPGFKPPARVD